MSCLFVTVNQPSTICACCFVFSPHYSFFHFFFSPILPPAPPFAFLSSLFFLPPYYVFSVLSPLIRLLKTKLSSYFYN